MKKAAITTLLLACILLNLTLAKDTTEENTKNDYAARAVNYHDGKFTNSKDNTLSANNPNPERYTPVSTKDTQPQDSLPTVAPTFLDPENKLTVTWFGHSTLLIQMANMNILFDPVFSQRTSPVSFIGPKRYNTLPCTIDDLPNIDILIITHDHYDHLDKETIQKIDEKITHIIVPLGVEKRLHDWGIAAEKIHNMAWWEEHTIQNITIACTPGRHFSGRWLHDTSETLWASWVLKTDTFQLFESGDTGFGEHFAQIHERYGDFNLVMLDCAQYNIKWPQVHMTPEESVTAAQILGAKIAMPIHWGALQLSNHPWDDPAERFVIAANAISLPVVTPKQGITMDLRTPEKYQTHWWRTVK